MTSSQRMRWIRLFMVLALAAGLLAVASPATADHDTQVKFTVKYKDANGDNQPLADVEVFLWDGAHGARYKCTNAEGVARFRFVDPGGGHIAATGAGTTAGCENSKFLRPGDNKKLLSVFYNGHVGVRQFDPFAVNAFEHFKIKFITKAPEKNWKVCDGLKATNPAAATKGNDIIVGTEGNDVLVGRAGHDLIKGLGGDDTICGGDGNDRIVAGAGDDTMFGEGGNDKPRASHADLPTKGKGGLYGGWDEDTAHGGPGDDKCKAETKKSC